MTNSVFEIFISKWVNASDLQPIAADELRELEVSLQSKLPVSYAQFLAKYGAPGTNITLLEAIVDRELDIDDISEFFAPKEVVENTNGWRELGLSKDAFCFAGDGFGNMFCFKAIPFHEIAPVDAAVWFFLHEEQRTEELNPSFIQWMGEYAAILPTK